MNIYITGVGGQGVLTVAEILASAAMGKGLECNYFPTKGMAQRGGFVKAQMKIGNVSEGPDIAPKTADVAINMELSESLRAVRYVRNGGDFLVFMHRWLPTDVMLGRADYPNESDVINAATDAELNCVMISPDDFPSDAAQNIVFLGSAMKHTALKDVFSVSEIKEALRKRFPAACEKNFDAFDLGYASVAK